MEAIASGRRGTVSHLVPDEIMKTTNLITAEQRAQVRLTREEKRLIFFMNKALEALAPDERANILKVLNINPPDLQPISENEFRKLIENKTVAFTKYKYHHERRLANYFKIKDFMDQAQRRHGSGRCIYLSKEGSKLLLRKKHTKSIAGLKNVKGLGLDLEPSNMISIDRLSDRSKGSGRRNYAVSAMESPKVADKVFQKKLSMPQMGTLAAEIIANDKLMRRQRKNLKHAQVQRNKEFISQQYEMRKYKIVNKDEIRKKEKEEKLKEEELEKQDAEEAKEEKKQKLLQSKRTLEEEYFKKMRSVQKRLEKKQSMAEELIIEAKSSASPLIKKMRKQGSISMQNLQKLNYQSGDIKGPKPIIKVNNDHTTTAGDDLSVLHDNYSSHEKLSRQDRKEKPYHAHYMQQPSGYRNRPATAQADYNHKLYERAAKRHEQFNEENIENLKINIECKMLNAEQKKKQRIAMISYNIRLDNFKKEQMQLNKLKEMDGVLNPNANIKQDKKGEFDPNISVESPTRPSSSRIKTRGSTIGEKRQGLTKVQSARQIKFTSLKRQVRDHEYTPGQHHESSIGLLESHIQPNTRAALDIKVGQNMLKQQSALNNIYLKQTKVNENRQKDKEEKKYQHEEKQEKLHERRAQANVNRTKINKEKFNRIQSAIARKEKQFSDDGIHSGVHSLSAKSAQGKVWKNLAIRDQQEKIERMQEVQKAYKERLFEEMLYKEEKYNKIQFAKKQLVQNAQMPVDYGIISLIEQEKGRNNPVNKSLFNVQKSSYNASAHEIPTNLQLKKGVY